MSKKNKSHDLKTAQQATKCLWGIYYVLLEADSSKLKRSFNIFNLSSPNCLNTSFPTHDAHRYRIIIIISECEQHILDSLGC
jgi:hypothetical protein